jgi:hypothetical protein
MQRLHAEPTARRRSSGTLLAGGSAGTLATALSVILPDPWKGWLQLASPWVAAMVAALWPNAWERFKWGRLRHQGMDMLDALIIELKQFHAQATSAAVRHDTILRIHQLEAQRLRITAAVPFMQVSIHADTDESGFPVMPPQSTWYEPTPPPGP